MNKIFFYSDSHFAHSNIIRFSNRPFSSIEEHDEALIERWNSVVTDKDEVYHLGDVAFWKDNYKPTEYIKQLKGRKHLILGNHDKLKPFEYLKMGFTSVNTYLEIKYNKRKVVLCHYPILSWNGMHRGTWHLHGHCHSTINHLNEGLTRIDVGVDNFNFYPVSFEEIEVIFKDRVAPIVDHHGQNGER